MKPVARFAAVGAGVAVVVAIAASLYLRKSHEAVERVVKAVELSAPDLFPSSTLLYAEMQGWDQSYGRAEEWWKKFETTASRLVLQREWDKNKLGLPEKAVEMLQAFDKELDRCEQKFGYRPTTRQFWESYGKHIAVGVLPAPKGERPRFLLATRLPEGGVKALQGHLSKAGGVKACEPPLHKGFPVFQETVADGKETLYYGVGRGYGFFSDSLPDIRSALERLALATDEGKKPDGTLAHDATLTRVRPPKGKKESGVIYLRRDQKFGEWMPGLAMVDEFVRNAFVLAPKDEAVAFSMPDGPDGEVRCSFHDATPKPWTKSLPSGLMYLEASAIAPAGEARKFRDAEAAALFNRPLWKELDAFLSDPKKVRQFLDEALPPDERPDDELAKRLPNDARLLGAWMKDWLMSAVDIEAPQFAMASKLYPREGGAAMAQSAFGIDMDPFSVFVIAGGLDLLRSRWPEWIVRDDRPGFLSWSLDMNKALQAMRENAPPDAVEMIESFVAHLGPSLQVSGNRVLLVFGPEFAKEIAAGGPSFEDDPLYVEARGQVRPGFMHVSWDRAGERVAATYGPLLGWIESMLDKSGQDEEGLEIIGAGLKTVHRAIGWAKPSRASLATSYLDPAKPYESVELIDAQAEKDVPRLVPPDATARAPDFLPADTWLYRMQRMELKPSYDEMRAEFVKALPGGEERLAKLEVKPDVKELVDALIEGIIRNVKGEVGFAIATPRPQVGGPDEPGIGFMMSRLPVYVMFAEFEKPVDGFRAAWKFLERLHQEVTPRAPRPPRNEWEAPPLYTEFKVGMVGEQRAAAIDFYLPMGREYAVISLCAVERGGFVFLTTSADFVKRLGALKEKDEGTFAARLAKSLPAGAAPEKVSSLGLFHGDTLILQVRMYLEMVSRMGVGLTLRGYRDEPPPHDRIQAHLEGWAKWIDLALDLFKTKSWSVSSTSRTGNTVRSKSVTVPEK